MLLAILGGGISYRFFVRFVEILDVQFLPLNQPPLNRLSRIMFRR